MGSYRDTTPSTPRAGKVRITRADGSVEIVGAGHFQKGGQKKKPAKSRRISPHKARRMAAAGQIPPAVTASNWSPEELAIVMEALAKPVA
jgi:hypothetical protein